MAGPGNTIPKPADQRRRRNVVPGTIMLPAKGRKGRPPAWPLEVVPKTEERRLWGKLWRTPQAVAWEDYEWFRVVGRYVRVVIEAENELDTKLLAEARQLEDRLGLNPLAMLRLRWEVTDDEIGARRQEAAPTADDRRRRLNAAG
jgi:hypothetical protein